MTVSTTSDGGQAPTISLAHYIRSQAVPHVSEWSGPLIAQRECFKVSLRADGGSQQEDKYTEGAGRFTCH